jgi:hypothetical protein
MPNYSNGKIYSIRFFDNDNHIYIGSTCQSLAVRLGEHKRKKERILYKYIQETYDGNWSKCYIELYQNFKCDNKEQLNKREGEVIREFMKNEEYIIFNLCIAGRTDKEYRQDNKQKLKEYREQNKDDILKYQKEYREQNKELISKKKKEFYEQNKDNVSKTKKEFYEQNKDDILKKSKEYREKNKELISKKKKEFYEQNKEAINNKRKELYRAKKEAEKN